MAIYKLLQISQTVFSFASVLKREHQARMDYYGYGSYRKKFEPLPSHSLDAAIELKEVIPDTVFTHCLRCKCKRIVKRIEQMQPTS